MANKSCTNKRKSEWISSSFGDPSDDFFNIGNPNKRKESNVIDLTTEEEPFNDLTERKPWIEKYKPWCENDLAVHKKKVQDIKFCLQGYLLGDGAKNEAGILLLSGPAGTGKTAVIEVLAKALNCELKEWINPVGQNYEEKSSDWRDYLTRQDSQSKIFNDFLLRANRYCGLTMVGENEMEVKSRKIVLIEDLPNFIIRDPKKLHVMLRQYLHSGRNPLVFILSDARTSDATVHSIFPKNIQAELRITNTSFNAVAMTSLIKSMNKIVKEECKMNENIIIPSKEIYEMLATSSNGDIRSCINSLQFYCTNSKCERKKGIRNDEKVKQKPKKNTKPNTKSTDIEVAGICGRDASLFLFRALGKILYSKRIPKGINNDPQLPPHFKHLTRDPLQADPEDVFERAQITSDMFVLYLHQNYPLFFNNIDDLSSASTYISDADIMTGLWANRQVMSDYSSSTAMRGIMFCNTGGLSATGTVSGGWRPLHKPQFFESIKTRNNHTRNCKELFQETQQNSFNLFTEVLPYLSILNIPLKSSGHAQLVQEIGKFSKNKQNQRNFPQSLTDGVYDDRDDIGNDYQFRYQSKLLNQHEINIGGQDDELIEDFDEPLIGC